MCVKGAVATATLVKGGVAVALAGASVVAALKWDDIKAKGRRIIEKGLIIIGVGGGALQGGLQGGVDAARDATMPHKARIEAEQRKREAEKERRRKSKEGERGDGGNPPPDPND